MVRLVHWRHLVRRRHLLSLTESRGHEVAWALLLILALSLLVLRAWAGGGRRVWEVAWILPSVTISGRAREVAWILPLLRFPFLSDVLPEAALEASVLMRSCKARRCRSCSSSLTCSLWCCSCSSSKATRNVRELLKRITRVSSLLSLGRGMLVLDTTGEVLLVVASKHA